MANAWFESVAEAQRRAKKRLPKGVYGALVAGSERGLSDRRQTAAFAELGFAPHVAGLSNERNMGVTVMGQAMSMPVMISPTGVQAVHPDGEVAVARAAAAAASRWGCPRSPASRSRRSWRPTRRPSSRCTGSAPARTCSPAWSGPAGPAPSA
jgi:isopentenyl diphosphate isomerase/L-lactate dehydrogenase-like FMN-dependent dehydrogenase